jgi:hypothetical protein
MIELPGSRRAIRSFKDCPAVVCLDLQILQPLFFHNAGLDEAVEPEHGFVGCCDDKPDLRNKLAFGSRAAR